MIALIHCLVQVVVIGVLCATVLPVHAGVAPAGKLLLNQAKAEFTDARGVKVVVLSNEVSVEVAAVYALLISPSLSSLPATAGVPLEFTHELRYLGNAPARIAFAGQATDMALYGVVTAVDQNGDGVHQDAEVLAAGQTLAAAPGATWLVWVTVPVPASLPELASAGWRWRASVVGAESEATAEDRFEVTDLPRLSLTASVSPTAGLPGTLARFSAVLRNTGVSDIEGITARVDGAPLDGLYIRLPVPSNTSFSAAHVSQGRILYRPAGYGLSEYVSTLPGNPDDVMEAVWWLPDLPAGTIAQFDVDVMAGAVMPPSIVSRFTLDYRLHGVGQTIDSQDLVVVYPETDHGLGIVDNGFLTSLLYVAVDSQFSVEIQSPRCNADRARREQYPVSLTTRLSSDAEQQFIAEETGDNTGVFRLAGVPVDAWPERATSHDNERIEAARDDVIDVAFQCPVDLLSGSIAVAGSATVFDALSGAGIAGATVTVQQLGQGTWQSAILNDSIGTPLPATQTTDEQGRFRLGVGEAGTYRIVVSKNNFRFPSQVAQALLPQPNQVLTGYSYGEPVDKTAPARFTHDVPLDPSLDGGLLLSKTANKQAVRAGDKVHYTLMLRHGRPHAWPGVQLVDNQDGELALLTASVLVNGKTAAPAATNAGFELALPPLAAGVDTVVEYDVLVRQGTDRKLKNQAQATSAFGYSNPAEVTLERVSDLTSGDTVVLVDAFQDCDADGRRAEGEVGVPGVRFYLANGRFVFTDDRGMAHFTGVEARSTMLRLDETTLPAGMQSAASGALASKTTAQQILPLQQQGLRRVSWPIAGCTDAANGEISKRLQAWKKAESEEVAVSEKLVSSTSASVQSADVTALPAAELLSKQKSLTEMPLAQADNTAAPVFADVPFTADLIHQVLEMDKAIGFIDLQDGAVLRDRQATVRVKGRAGTTMRLTVDGAEVAASQLGQQVVYGRGGVQAMEFVGVKLAAGKNQLVVVQKDPFGNVRGTAAITVWAPGAVQSVAIDLDPAQAISDGRTPFRFRVQLRDADNRLVPESAVASISVSSGSIDNDDIDERTPGVQVKLEDGEVLVQMQPVSEPKIVTLDVSVGTKESKRSVAFKPHLRPLFATGMIEALWQRGDVEALGEAQANEFGWPGSVFSDRGQLFIKGRVKGDRLLTLAYDSDKERDARALRQLDPERYYPVYGDRGVAGYEAQSTGKLYVRLEDDNELWLLGDFATDPENEAIKLGAHRDVGNGVKVRIGAEPGRYFSWYAQQHDGGLVTQEFPGAGIGPYALSAEPSRAGEVVSVVVRSALDHDNVLSEQVLTPFIDYTLDPFAQVIYLREPLLATDSEFNAVSLRVRYRAEEGVQSVLAGAEATVSLTDDLRVFVTGHHDEEAFSLLGSAGLAYKADEHNVVVVERGTYQGDKASGASVRAEWRFRSDKTQGRVEWQDLDEGFDNPTALAAKPGQIWRSSLTHELALGHTTSLELRQDTPDAGLPTRSALWRNNRHFDRFNLDAGLRVTQYGDEETDSAVIRGDYSPKALPALSVFAETEQAVQDVENRLTLGADYRLENQARAYFKHDVSGSETAFADPGSTLAGRRQTVLGLRTGSSKSAEWYSEYRAQTEDGANPEADDGSVADVVLGVRKMWEVNDNWSLEGGVERSQAMTGEQGDSLGLTTGARYKDETGQWRWRGEHRAGDDSRYDHLSVAAASRLATDWALLLRVAVEDSFHADKESSRVRTGAGFAYRPASGEATSWLFMANHIWQSGTEAKERLDVTSQTSTPLTDRWNVSGFAGMLDVDATDYRYRAQHMTLQPEWLAGEKIYVGARVGYYCDNAGADTVVTGVEVGYRFGEGLFSVGYNRHGATAKDAPSPVAEGVFLRLRLPLDEQWLGWLTP